MKRFVICLLVLLLLVMPTVVRAAVAWDSYSDEARTIQSDDFDQYGSFVYMKAAGLPGQDGYYEARYYDADMVQLQTETNMSSNGEFLSLILPSAFEGSAAAGTWTAELYDLTPKMKLLVTDTFYVQASAIPEFPTVVSGIGVVVVCGVIFLWMRKKRV